VKPDARMLGLRRNRFLPVAMAQNGLAGAVLRRPSSGRAEVAGRRSTRRDRPDPEVKSGETVEVGCVQLQLAN
jgi:hypothetical protein